MTQKTTQTRSLVFAICLSALAYFASCKKPDAPVTIVGTWTPSSETQVTKQSNTPAKDTTFTLTPALLGITSVTFTASGQAIIAAYPTGLDTGTYTYAAGMLNIITPGGGGTSTPSPAVLTATTLSVTSLDTTSTSPLIIQTNTMVFNKQ